MIRRVGRLNTLLRSRVGYQRQRIGYREMKHRIAQRLSIMTCLICSVIAPMVSLADDEMTIHGTSIRNSEDPKNPTATSETLSIDEVEPTLGAVLENATGVGIRRSGNLGRSEFIQLRGTLGHQAQIFVPGTHQNFFTRAKSNQYQSKFE